MRIVIWGHKTNGHTHSHIHYGYYKAFKYMGFETFWFDDDILNDFDFSNCIFLTEGQVDKNIPIRSDCTYILHHCNPHKYQGTKLLNLGNYLKLCEEGISPNHPNNSVEKIKDLCFFDKVSNTLYQTWATDLLPHEIDIKDACVFDNNKSTINFIGYVWGENEKQIKEFESVCNREGKRFNTHFGVTHEENRRLTRESYISPDFRGEWHVKCGYVPCRIFKSISYGVPVGTNSYHVHSLFPGFVAYGSNGEELYRACVDMYSKLSIHKIREAMTFVGENHTYLNRIENILSILDT